jgi:hypothetical protein
VLELQTPQQRLLLAWRRLQQALGGWHPHLLLPQPPPALHHLLWYALALLLQALCWQRLQLQPPHPPHPLLLLVLLLLQLLQQGLAPPQQQQL